jgi:hypothetical protein
MIIIGEHEWDINSQVFFEWFNTSLWCWCTLSFKAKQFSLLFSFCPYEFIFVYELWPVTISRDIDRMLKLTRKSTRIIDAPAFVSAWLIEEGENVHSPADPPARFRKALSWTSSCPLRCFLLHNWLWSYHYEKLVVSAGGSRGFNEPIVSKQHLSSQSKLQNRDQRSCRLLS